MKNNDVKKLIWRDNITESGKKSGLFEIIADVEKIEDAKEKAQMHFKDTVLKTFFETDETPEV